MDPATLYRDGRLAEAIEAQLAIVKAHPTDQAKRLFLFELVCFAGDLDRARRQIELLNYSDPGLDAAAQAYRKAIDAEESRRKLFRDGVAPQFFAGAPDHCVLRLKAVQALRSGQPEEASRLLGEADEATPKPPGLLNDRPFALLRDADDLFSGVLEVIAHGDYYWVPLEEIVSLTVMPPQYPRDLIYLPAKLELADAHGDVFLPALYPGSHEHSDNAIKLGRMTDWKPLDDQRALGVGLKLFLMDDDDLALPDWRSLSRPEDEARTEAEPRD